MGQQKRIRGGFSFLIGTLKRNHALWIREVRELQKTGPKYCSLAFQHKNIGFVWEIDGFRIKEECNKKKLFHFNIKGEWAFANNHTSFLFHFGSI